ncbi:glycosyl transferase, partial [Streptomyces solincola]
MVSIAAHGHVYPHLDVVRELVARGHRVSYAIPPAFADQVAATGARPVPYTSTLPVDDDPDAWGTELIDNIEPFLTDAMQALPQLAEAFEGDVPDLVLHDTTAAAGAVLAHRWGVPAVSLWTHLVPWKGYEEEVAEPMYAELKRSERGKAYYARYRGWLAENGIDTDPDDFVARPRRAVVTIPRALQPHADRVDEAVYRFVGPCQGDRSGQGAWQRPAGAEKVLLVSLGSAFTKQPAFYRACVEAFGDLPGWHVVLQIGKHVDPSELGDVPGNIEVRDWVPQLDVLRHPVADLDVAGDV